MPNVPEDVARKAAERAGARAAKDFARADALRDEIAAAGWTVVDGPAGFRLEPATVPEPPAAPARVRAPDVASALEEPSTADVSVHWVLEGWPEDVERALAAFRAHAGGRRVQYVVADVTGADPSRWGEDVEVLNLEEGTGWGAARNAGLKRSTGKAVFVMDGSVEPAGDVFGPLEDALADPTVGVAGPFGIVTKDLREFDEAPGPGDCDAIEGYFMALRRDVLATAGLFDERFRWYRTADIEYSFRVKDRGLRAVVVPVPVDKHEHRMWFNTSPEERAKWSKRNYYRFLERWRDRWDLCVAPEPTAPSHHRHDHDDHDHDHGDH
ncbi:MAG: glycosyltransferase, partial [Actinobacteria bacterium]|nr:glycosyltransferase [Actinomycetota bacterium]